MPSDDRDAADRLADATGRERDAFDADEKPIPDLDDLKAVGDADDSVHPVIIEKRAGMIGDATPTSTGAIHEVARDSWPKLVASETRVYDRDGDTVIYHGPADPLLYDAEDVQDMKDSDTVTVVTS